MRSSMPRPVFFVPFVFLLGIFVAKLPATIGQFIGVGADFFAPISDVRQFLADSYVDKPDMDKVRDGAISGMLEALDDPYAQYVPPDDRADFEKALLGSFCGIGAEIQIEGGYPTIVTPLDDSPAFRAGILAGDKITAINGESSLGYSIDDCVKKLSGEPGSTVHLALRRGEKTVEVDITRQQIVLRAVKGVDREDADGHWNFMLDPDRRIAYIRLSQFIPTAPDEMAQALASVGAPDGHLGGLILDLRDDPGGDLDACLDIADMFIRDGTLVSVRGRNGLEQVHEAAADGTLPDFPMVVLVNGFSASASEILAGALSDHHRAVIVGSRTFGKGLVQTVRGIPSLPGAQVKYTIQRYYLPSGRLIQREDDSKTWGVDPTPGFYVGVTDDEQLAAVLKRRDLDILRAGDQASAHSDANAQPARWGDPAWVETELKDKQLAAAMRAVDTRLASGDWKPVSDATEQFAMIHMSELRSLEKTHQRMSRALIQVEQRIDALDSAVAGSTAPHAEAELWPETLDLTGGEVRVVGKDGKLVAVLKITGHELERWLALADVQPVNKPDTDAPGSSQARNSPDPAAASGSPK